MKGDTRSLDFGSHVVAAKAGSEVVLKRQPFCLGCRPPSGTALRSVHGHFGSNGDEASLLKLKSAGYWHEQGSFLRYHFIRPD